MRDGDYYGLPLGAGSDVGEGEGMELLKRMMMVRVTEDMWKEVQREAHKRGMRLSQLVRLIIAEWLREKEDDIE